MSKRIDQTEITPVELLDSIKCSFEIAINALVQAKTNLGILGFDKTKQEVQKVVEDLRTAVKNIDDFDLNLEI